MSNIMPYLDFGRGIQEIIQNDSCSVMRVENETGEGVMTVYRLFPGAFVMYQDFHMAYCMSEFHAEVGELLCIDHCREGCMEQAVGHDAYTYFEPGSVSVDTRQYHEGRATFPQNHFHGVSIAFYLPQAEAQLARELKGFSVSLRALQEKLCGNGRPHDLGKENVIEGIFHSIYGIPVEERSDFLRIKLFELLLRLDGISGEQHNTMAYFYKSHVDKTKAAQQMMTENLSASYTVEALSSRFHIPQSALKSCFKAMFGQPIHTYLQDCRMKRAALLLRVKEDMSVASIAGQVGYDSPGKFAAIFKRVYGVTPRAYRNGGIR